MKDERTDKQTCCFRFLRTPPFSSIKKTADFSVLEKRNLFNRGKRGCSYFPETAGLLARPFVLPPSVPASGKAGEDDEGSGAFSPWQGHEMFLDTIHLLQSQNEHHSLLRYTQD